MTGNTSRQSLARVLVRAAAGFLLSSSILPAMCLAEAGRERIGVPILECASPTKVSKEGLILHCTIRNNGNDAILFLQSDATLDGPMDAVGYIHRMAGGRRYENVLQFGCDCRDAFEAGGLSHPWVDLTDDDLRALRYLAPGAVATIKVKLDGDAIARARMNGNNCVLRLKLVYAREPQLRSRRLRAVLPPACNELLEEAMVLSKAGGGRLIRMRMPEPGLRGVLNGCNDEVSSIFEHVFSNFVELQDSAIRPASREREEGAASGGFLRRRSGG